MAERIPSSPPFRFRFSSLFHLRSCGVHPFPHGSTGRSSIAETVRKGEFVGGVLAATKRLLPQGILTVERRFRFTRFGRKRV
ncbi:hypothetical protein LINPERHAP1_LOCUS38108 [Linum perenne]